MLKITKRMRDAGHRNWHEWQRGGCMWCGFHCSDCPIGIAMCKCWKEEEEGENE